MHILNHYIRVENIKITNEDKGELNIEITIFHTLNKGSNLIFQGSSTFNMKHSKCFIILFSIILNSFTILHHES